MDFHRGTLDTGPMGLAYPRSIATLVLLSATLAVGGCNGRRLRDAAFAPPSADEIAGARGDYRAACAACHGIDGRGDGPVATSLDPRPADLTLLAARRGGTFPSDDVLAVVVGDRRIDAHGTRAMPIWSDRFDSSSSGATAVASIHTRRRLEMLATYLATIQRTQ